MSGFESSTATLRFSGENLVPEEITARLGSGPTHSTRKGEVTIGRKTGQQRIARTGCWILSAPEHEPEGLDRQINGILGRLTADLKVWRALTKTYRAEMFCGLFMSSGNDGMELSAATLRALGTRGLAIWLDVYDHLDE